MLDGQRWQQFLQQRCGQLRIQRQHPRAALQQRQPGQQRRRLVKSLQRHPVTCRYALRGKADRQRVNVGAQVAPGQRLVIQAQRLRLSAPLAPVAPGPVAKGHNSASSVSMLIIGRVLSGHGRTSWALISDRVSSPGMVCGVSQAATRAS